MHKHTHTHTHTHIHTHKTTLPSNHPPKHRRCTCMCVHTHENTYTHTLSLPLSLPPSHKHTHHPPPFRHPLSYLYIPHALQPLYIGQCDLWPADKADGMDSAVCKVGQAVQGSARRSDDEPPARFPTRNTFTPVSGSQHSHSFVVVLKLL